MPAGELVRWVDAGLLIAVLAVAAGTDVLRRQIPNWTVLAVIALGAIWLLTQPETALASLGAAAIVFLVSFALYSFRVIGAGDSKLLTAVALFAGMKDLLPFTIYTAMAGGAVAVLILTLELHGVMAWASARSGTTVRRGVPYGVAIAVGTLAVVLPRLT